MTHVKITIFRDLQDLKDQPDPLGLQVQEELQVVQVPQECLVSQELKAQWAQQDLKDFKDRSDLQALQGPLEQQEILVSLDLPVLLVLKVFLEPLVPLVVMEQLDHKEVLV
jgi:hypothetical protein